MTIKVLSFDFDGCLFNSSYVKSCGAPGPKDKVFLLFHHNQLLFTAIKAEIETKAYAKVIGFVGSNRQSKLVDIQNEGKKGSCFPAMEEVAKFLGITLDKFLLADVYGNLEPGLSYDRAMKYSLAEAYDAKFSHAEWTFDASKISLLYAQIHKIAFKYSYESILFDFYDDRADILEGLEDFFSKNPSWLPSNLILRLHRYAGEEVVDYAPIQGTGLIDWDFQETVKKMGTLVGKNLRPNDHSITIKLIQDILHHNRECLLSVDSLANFAPKVSDSRDEIENWVKEEQEEFAMIEASPLD